MEGQRFSKRYVFDPPAEGMGMFNMVYIFNFCDFKDLNCNGKQVAAFEALEVMMLQTLKIRSWDKSPKTVT